VSSVQWAPLQEDANMRPIMIAILAAAAIGFFSPSGVSAAPANGSAIGEAATAAQMIEKAQRYRRRPRRRRPYTTYRPYAPSGYTYRPYAPSGEETLHQLSEENQQRAQQNSALGGQ
jgi:hypothetical protein